MDARKLLRSFEERLEPTLDAIREIVEIESPSFCEEGSRAVVDRIARMFSDLEYGCRIEEIPAAGCGVHLLVRCFPESEGEPVLILGHTDTVHPLGSTGVNKTRIEDGRLYGCGTFDMKANIAVLIEVLRSIRENGSSADGPVNILLSCDEEVGSETGRPLVEREAARAGSCLVLEPSSAGRVKTARKGTGGYVIRVFGKAAHAGLDPEKGASAILEISRQIALLDELNDPAAGATVTVGTIRGGTATNVVPAEAECAVDVRFSTIAAAKELEERIMGLKPFDARTRIEVSGEINRPPLERTEAVAELFRRARTLAASFDYALGETMVGGASDGNFVGAAGVPLLDGLGVTGDGAHTLDEHIMIDDIPKRATLLALLLCSRHFG